MRFYASLITLFVTSCTIVPSSLTSPSRLPVDKKGRPKMSCSVTVTQIPPVAGEGYIWLQASTVGDCQGGPKWVSSSPNCVVTPYQQDPTIAYVGGYNGTYVVTAHYTNGDGQIEVTIDHE